MACGRRDAKTPTAKQEEGRAPADPKDMKIWEKLVNDPGHGPRTGSPLAHAALGMGLLAFALHVFITDSIRVSRAGDGVYIHFADHPKTFVTTVVCTLLASGWNLVSARKRYLKHS